MTNNVAKLEGAPLAENPFGSAPEQASSPTGGNALMTAESQRAVAEIQAMTMMAMQYRRDQQLAMDRILNECQRPSLAEAAIYSYHRGGTEVTGATIRLAEVLKREWGHIRSGWRCLERTKGRSLIQAYAYDMQANVAEERTFEVRHIRNTKRGSYPITDERDIYELEANQAARRVRACILALIPGDVQETALNQCKFTLEAQADLSPQGLKKMLDAFAVFGVNQAMIEARIGRNLSSITAAQKVALSGVRNSLKDGMSKPDQWFDMELSDKSDSDANDANASLKNKINKAKKSTGKIDEKDVTDSSKDVKSLCNKRFQAINQKHSYRLFMVIKLNQCKALVLPVNDNRLLVPYPYKTPSLFFPESWGKRPIFERIF